jgi:hypothetical protein
MFLLLSLSESLEGCRATEWRVCEHREDFSSVTKEIYTAFFSSDFLVCIHTWTACIIRRSSHQRVPQLAGPRFEPYLVTGRRDAKPLYRNIDTWKETI